jgi:NADPH:quinone reductase-like Zn-dependent oxidoreductase
MWFLISLDIKNGKGPISSLFIREEEKPRPIGMQALVKIKAFGINRMDLIQREGLYPLPPQAGPIMGVEFSGIVESIGDDAGSGFQIGDEVFGLAYGGIVPSLALTVPLDFFSTRVKCDVC